MARITAIGGVFFYSPDPKALSDGYREKLGLDIQDWGGAMIRAEDTPLQFGVWSPFKTSSDYFKPSKREFMVNFAVDDLDAYVAGLEAKGLEIQGRQDMEGMGKFAWVLDPDGTKVEFWEPEKE